MNKPKRVVIRPELLPDAKKIQRACGLESCGAAVNLVFALYREQFIERLTSTPSEATTIVAASERSVVQASHPGPPSASVPRPVQSASPNAAMKLRDFLQQAKSA